MLRNDIGVVHPNIEEMLVTKQLPCALSSQTVTTEQAMADEAGTEPPRSQQALPSSLRPLETQAAADLSGSDLLCTEVQEGQSMTGELKKDTQGDKQRDTREAGRQATRLDVQDRSDSSTELTSTRIEHSEEADTHGHNRRNPATKSGATRDALATTCEQSDKSELSGQVQPGGR